MNIIKLDKYKNNIAFSQNPSNQEEKPQAKKMSRDTKILLALGGLATIAVAGVLIYKNRKAKKIITPDKKLEPWEKLVQDKKELLAKFESSSKEDWEKVPSSDRQNIEELSKTIKEFSNYIQPKHKDDLIKLSALFELDKKEPQVPVPNLIIVHGPETENIEDFIEGLPKLVGLNIQKTKSFPEALLKTVKNITESSKNGEERTLLYVENLREILHNSSEEDLSKLKSALENPSKKHKITLIGGIYESLYSEEMKQFANKNAFELEAKPWEWTEERKKINNEMLRITNNAEKEHGLFKNFLPNDENLKSFLYVALPIERLSKRNNSIQLANIIMVQGNDEKSIDKVIETIPLMSDFRFAQISYDPQNPDETLKNLYNAGKKAKEHFQQTRVRTILRIDNLEEMLSNKNTIEGRSCIGGFNDFADICSDKFHTTVLFKALKPENLQSAARSRAEIVLEINKKEKEI